MSVQLVVVDSFTARPFHGNPAAVAIVEVFPPDEQMQLIAREMNLSETAFAACIGEGEYALRWFTPTTEVDLCGHATLAVAHVLSTPVRFHTKSGVLSCEPGEDGWITMDFPADPPKRLDQPDWLDIPGMTWFGSGRVGALVELDNEALVRSFEPDLGLLARLSTGTVTITARSGNTTVDFVSRVFGPAVGIAEDPVTGSAHCMLAEFWGDRFALTTLTGEQASLRGGIVRMDRKGERVALSGQAVTVSRVQFTI